MERGRPWWLAVRALACAAALLLAADALALDPNVGGTWSAPISWPHIPVSMAGLPDGRILTFSSNEPTGYPIGPEYTYAGVFDPATGLVTEIPHSSHDMFCASLVMLEDGSVFVSGGRNFADSPWTSLFDFRTDSWIQIEDMNEGRWYPTAVALPTGQVFVAAGDGGGRYPEIWTPGQGWTLLTGIDLQPAILDFGGVANGAGSWPLLQLDPTGKIFHAGATPLMHRFDPLNGLGTVEPLGAHGMSWFADEAVSVLYDEGMLLIAGGSTSLTDSTSVADAVIMEIAGPAPVVRATAPMNYPRQFHDEILLPTGEVLVIGGNTSGIQFEDATAVLEPEVFDPVTETWRLLNPMAIPRTYHSTATLMLDGRVLSAGGGAHPYQTATDHPDGEIYTPWYLYAPDGSLAPRPEITDAPGVLRVGSTFEVEATPGAADFSLIKISATTHTMNTDLRFLRPAFTEVEPGRYSITLHANPNVLTTGYWMLFTLDGAGVPSEAAVIQVVTDGVPRGAPIANRRDALGESVFLRVEAEDPDGLPITYSATGLPDGLTIDPDTGAIIGTLTATGIFNVDVFANDGTDGATVSFTWFVTSVTSEVGTLSVSQADALQWHTHTFAEPILDPIVVMGPATLDDPDYTTVRVRNVTPTGFEFQLDEWDYLDGAHGPETLSYLAVSSGAHKLSDDSTLVAGSMSGVNATFQGVLLPPGAFTAPPVVLAQVSSADGGEAVAVRVDAVTASGFELRMQEQESGDEVFVPETIHWVAVEETAIAGLLETGNTHSTSLPKPYGLDYPLAYGAPFSAPPHLFATMMTFKSSNNATLRQVGATASDVVIHLSEEESFDTELAHSWEDIGWLAVDPSATTLALAPLFNAAPSVQDPGDQISNAQEPVSLDVLAQDADGDGVTFSALGLPSGLSIDPVTGEITGTPDTPGTSLVTVSVTDPQSASDSVDFEWTILEQLQLDPFPTPPAEAGQDVSYEALLNLVGMFLFTWDFGDGTPAVESMDATVTHAYLTPGRFVVTLTVSDPGTGRTDTHQFVQMVHGTPTPDAPTASSPIAYDAANDRVWVVNPDNDVVTVIDALAHARLQEIAVDAGPASVAVAGDGRVWVACKDAATIVVLDPVTFTVVQTIPLHPGSQPHGLVFDPAGAFAFVALQGSGELLRLDGATGAVLQTQPTGPWPRHLAVSNDGTTVYAPAFVTPPLPGEFGDAPQVEVLGVRYGGELRTFDATTLAPGPTIVLHHGEAPLTDRSGPGIPNYLGAPALSPDGTEAWIPSKQDNVLGGTARSGIALAHDSAVRAITSRVDLAGGVEDEAARLDHDDASVASASVFTATGDYLLTAIEGNREIVVNDAFGGDELGRFPTGRATHGMALSPDGRTLFAYNFMDRSVTVHDLSPLLDYDDHGVPTVATIDLLTSEALAPDVFLGKQLFYDSLDPRLSLEKYMACASCHNEGGDDGRVWDFTQFGEGPRNTIGLNGRGVGHGPVHWTANFDEIQDFEGQIRGFTLGLGLMSDADFFAGTRADPLGDPKAGLSPDLDALAAYVASLTSTGPSPHRAAGGALTADGVAGRALFAEVRTLCAQCHTGDTYTDSASLVKHAVGTLEIDQGDGTAIAIPLDTPTLRGLWTTAPYLHDGSAATIRDAIDRHAGLDAVVTPGEKDLLAAYLMQIDDDDTPPDPVPEPAAMLQLLAGAGLLAGLARRRRRGPPRR